MSIRNCKDFLSLYKTPPQSLPIECILKFDDEKNLHRFLYVLLLNYNFLLLADVYHE